MFKFEIINKSLVVTDTVTSQVKLDVPKGDVYYHLESLRDLAQIQIIDISSINTTAGTFTCHISKAVDSLLNTFSEATFQQFARDNLGFRDASYIETDPIFGSSEASLFVSGDKAKLDSIEIGAEVNVNADWNATSGDALILNKPSFVLDQTAIANADNVGRFRYYKDATYSYLEVCMESNSTYEWILISQQVLI